MKPGERPPLHLRIKQQILTQIAAGDLKPNERMPSEEALAEAFGVSRTTVRNALLSLEQEGVITRRHGIGTFVTPHVARLTSRIDEIMTIPELIRNNGFTPQMEHLVIAEAHGPAEAYIALGIPPDTLLTVAKRVYLADSHPAVYVVEYLPPAMRSPAVDWNDFQDEMLYFVERAMGVAIHHILSRITAVAAEAESVEWLAVPVGAPLLLLEQTIFTVDGQAVMYSHLYNNPQFIEYEVVRGQR